MSSIDALSLALGGLDVTKSRIDTLSRNISNAQTDGYSAKTQQQTVGLLGEVELGPVQRNVSDTLLKSLRQSTGDANQLGVTVNLLAQIEAAFGAPNSDTSLSSRITGLQNAFQDLSVNPEQGSLYSSATDAAGRVARTLNSLSQTVSSTRTDANTQIGEALTSVNETLQSIDQINKQIVAHRGDQDVTDEEDQRDRLISRLAGALDITTFQRADGGTAVYTRDGKPLVDRTVASLSLGAGTVVWASPNGAPATVRIGSGTLGGLLTLQSKTLPAIQGQLDDIARALTVEFNAINVPLFNDGGATALNPADPVQLNGYAARIAVNATVAATPTILRDGNSPVPLAAGDTTNIDRALALFNRTNIAFTPANGLPASASFVQAATDFIAAQSAQRADAKSALDSENALTQTFKNKISAQSGVNVDSEVAQLAVLQNAYAANARVLQTTKTLFDTLFNAFQ